MAVREILDAWNEGKRAKTPSKGHGVDEGGALLSSEGVRSVEEEGVAMKARNLMGFLGVEQVLIRASERRRLNVAIRRGEQRRGLR